MKPTELKQEYVRLRAEGQSYDTIAKTLSVSKTTCTRWERELAAEIDELKRAELAELYESYGMAKESRIKRLGNTLKKIDDALAQADFSEIDPGRLLEYKLKYMDALKGEYAGIAPPLRADRLSTGDILGAITELLNRARAGDITADQAQKESQVLANLLKAYETTEVKAKLDNLEAIVGGRQ